jgi:hypothetical protein
MSTLFTVQHSTHHHFFSKAVLRAERDRRARATIDQIVAEREFLFSSARLIVRQSTLFVIRLVALGIIACFMVSQHFNLKIHGASKVPSCNGGALLSISYGWFNIQ